MLRFVLLAAICVSVASTVLAEFPADPTLEELKEIAGKQHSAKLTSPELQIYPTARKYKIRATMEVPQREPATIEMDADEKWVDGTFIVSSFRFPGADELSQMIVTYDEDQHCFRKWVFSPQAIGETMVGTRVGDARTVSWVSSTSEDVPDKPIVLAQETHTDTSTSWSELHIKGAQVVARASGKAVLVK